MIDDLENSVRQRSAEHLKLISRFDSLNSDGKKTIYMCSRQTPSAIQGNSLGELQYYTQRECQPIAGDCSKESAPIALSKDKRRVA